MRSLVWAVGTVRLFVLAVEVFMPLVWAVGVVNLFIVVSVEGVLFHEELFVMGVTVLDVISLGLKLLLRVVLGVETFTALSGRLEIVFLSTFLKVSLVLVGWVTDIDLTERSGIVLML